MKNIKANRYFTGCLLLDPSRKTHPERPKDCWLGRKESSHASQNKQTNKPNAPTLPCQAQLSLIHVYAEPPQPHQSPSIHRMLFLGVSKKTYWCPGYNATVLDADSFMMHGMIQKILSGGWGVVGCPENSILVFHRGQCGPGLLFIAFGPKGSYFFSRLSITVFLTCDLPGGMQTRCPPPSGHAHAMLSYQSELCSSVSCLSA